MTIARWSGPNTYFTPKENVKFNANNVNDCRILSLSVDQKLLCMSEPVRECQWVQWGGGRNMSEEK